jgi:hypothetical protein
MPRVKLPEFQSPSLQRLRYLYSVGNEDVKCVVLEVVRLRQLVEDADYYRDRVDKCWKEEGLGKLAALYQFRRLMQDERSRMGYLGVYRGRPSDMPVVPEQEPPDEPNDPSQ